VDCQLPIANWFKIVASREGVWKFPARLKLEDCQLPMPRFNLKIGNWKSAIGNNHDSGTLATSKRDLQFGAHVSA
jgi:hypothetical protein